MSFGRVLARPLFLVPRRRSPCSPKLGPVSTATASVVRPDPRADIPGYLARLGLERPARPDVDSLFAIHEAHMTRVPYENLEIQLDRPTTVDPVESIARIVRGRGGYCFHLNGALGTLLASLGYDVTRHLGQVRGTGVDQDAPELTVNHQVLTVRCEGESWLVDCGLGDAPLAPMALRAGEHPQGLFTYRLAPWAAREGGWRFVHDPAARSFPSMVFAPEPVEPEAFAAAHQHLSTSPDSSFVQAAVVARCDRRRAVEVLRSRVFTRIDAAGRSQQVLDTPDEWYALLADVFGLDLPDVDAEARERLWRRVSASHEQWLSKQKTEEPAGA